MIAESAGGLRKRLVTSSMSRGAVVSDRNENAVAEKIIGAS